jgi:hypothetical protein
LEVACSDATDADGLDGLEVVRLNPVDVGVVVVVATLWTVVTEARDDFEIPIAVTVARDADLQALN